VKPSYLRGEEFAFPNLIRAQLDGFALNIIGSKATYTSVAKFVEKRRDGVFLLSITIDDIQKGVREMKEKGLVLACINQGNSSEPVKRSLMDSQCAQTVSLTYAS
jgi:hypothetical protein